MAGMPEPPRPTAASILAIIGGMFMIGAGILEILIGWSQSVFPLGPAGIIFVVSGVLGLFAGALVVTFGALVHLYPHHHVAYGVLILAFSTLSLASFAGGFGVGFVLGLVGGILAIVHHPYPAGPYLPPPPPIQRVCPRCGMVIDPSVRFCPHCGHGFA